MPCSNQHTSKNILLQCGIFSTGILLNFAGYLVLLGLQSSINIKDGIGAASVASTYVTASCFGVTFTPVLIRYVGPKKCILLSELTYLIYILLNYKSDYLTLIPAGIIVGIGEATLWPSIILYYVSFAENYGYSKKKESRFFVAEFIGGFYLVYQISWVFGNLLNYAVLVGGKRTNIYNTTSTSTPLSDLDLSICGKNDCQDPNTTDANLSRYNSASAQLVDTLIGVCAAMVVLAMLIQFFLVQELSSSNEKDQNEKIENQVSKFGRKNSSLQSTILTIKETFTLLVKPKQLLIMPFALYCGLILYFALGEAPRAFGSCMMGIEKIGLVAAITGGTGGLASYFTAKLNGKYGRNVAIAIALCLDISNYFLSLFWVPNEESLWVAYIVFVFYGLSNGTWQALVNEMYSEYFSDRLEIAMPIWNMCVLIGLAWQAGWSTSLCVYQKIYFHLAFLGFSLFCYVVSQFIYYRKRSEASPKNEETNASLSMNVLM